MVCYNRSISWMFFAGAGQCSQSQNFVVCFLTRILFICLLARCPVIWLWISKLPNLVNSQCSTNQDHGSTCLHGVRFSSPLSTVYLSSSPEYSRSCSSYLQKEDFWWLLVSNSSKKSYEYRYFSALEVSPWHDPKGFYLLPCSLTSSIMSNYTPLLPASK